MRFFATKVLSGAILVDPISSTAILINTAEVYDRSSLVGTHHERCINKKGIPALSTNLPINCRILAPWRLQASALTEHSRHVQIFLDEANYTDATKIALSEMPPTLATLPQTIFTYNTFDNGAPNCDGRLASRMFAHVASEVIKKKAEAILGRYTITSLLSQCRPDGRIIKTINDINALFPDGSTSIEILNNHDLSKSLKVLTQILQPYLSMANRTIASEIESMF
ncbi:uncharacterized protein RHIMIDRAFT_295998 [Rhizopus microsporus ATCC 52813]|uniref:Uncharacterized protein n=1 Tax=Rhizopus microsporus ATCC 52813 TaxID=1340429 RepID=A0A2G4SG07_RHIZD|nr:uncharacterized protein RHIMIDRAFT_295998 [Rhizopus microsporus ATCC 52813]PHZ07326.1 hypothetical protein RHIMIDRAFT_295998 [Rhizopus microsporus ATCC 52813]